MGIKLLKAKFPLKKRGIALLVAVIFMTVMLSFGATLASLAYKQAVLSSTSVQSDSAFYAADAALECALYADQQQSAFVYAFHSAINLPDANIIPDDCDGSIYHLYADTYDTTRLTLTERISFDSNKSCADITIYKYPVAQADGYMTYIFSQGYNVSCDVLAAGATLDRTTSRGIDIRY